MLAKSFVETQDYHAMTSGPAYNAVVGRRGAGKSALFIRLGMHFRDLPNVRLLTVKPAPHSFVGLVGAVRAALGEEAEYIRARELMRHCWQAVIHLHMLRALGAHDLPGWGAQQPMDTALRFVESLPTGNYNQLVYASGSKAHELEQKTKEILSSSGRRGVVLMDGIDEGWVAADVENGILGGLAAAAADLQDRESGIRLAIFIRDNMYRILAENDPDFSRIIAGDALRLDWDHDTLLELVAARSRALLNLSATMPSVAAWNKLAARDMQGETGFREMLKHTLYRPRDVVELLNASLQNAQRAGRSGVSCDFVEKAAQDISTSRLHDLKKEYAAVLPGLEQLLRVFSGQPAIRRSDELREWLKQRIPHLSGDAAFAAAKLGSVARVMQALYGVGFIGFEESQDSYRFCHDGSDIHVAELRPEQRVAIHPCYHRALDVSPADGKSLDVLLHANYEYGEVSPNSDEIEGLVIAHTRELVVQLAAIPKGKPGHGAFEEWSRQTIETLFSPDLQNVELHPAPASPSRRDVVASIESNQGPWKRIAQTHNTSQVVFEVKNYEDLGADAYQQVASYIGEGTDYGTIGFIVYRGESSNPNANERSHLLDQKRMQRTIVLLPESLLCRLLKKSTAKEIRDKFRKWYDNHVRKWSMPHAGARSPTKSQP